VHHLHHIAKQSWIDLKICVLRRNWSAVF